MFQFSNLTVFFKKVAMVVVATTMSVTAYAQMYEGDKAFGGSLLIAGDETTLAGIGANFQYNITDPIRLEGSFSYFFPKKESERYMGTTIETSLNMWNLSLNGHYLLPISDKVTAYPLAGLGIAGLKAKASALEISESVSKNLFGVNLGGGLDYHVTDAITFNVEARYFIANEGGIYFLRAGVAFRF